MTRTLLITFKIEGSKKREVLEPVFFLISSEIKICSCLKYLLVIGRGQYFSLRGGFLLGGLSLF